MKKCEQGNSDKISAQIEFKQGLALQSVNL